MVFRNFDLFFGMLGRLGVVQHGEGPPLALLLHNTQIWLGLSEPQFAKLCEWA